MMVEWTCEFSKDPSYWDTHAPITVAAADATGTCRVYFTLSVDNLPSAKTVWKIATIPPNADDTLLDELETKDLIVPCTSIDAPLIGMAMRFEFDTKPGYIYRCFRIIQSPFDTAHGDERVELTMTSY